MLVFGRSLEDAIDWLASLCADESQDPEFRVIAGHTLLDHPRERHRQVMEQLVELQPGDSLLIFSDGAFEIHNDKDELLGVDGLARILASSDYPQNRLNMDELQEELLKFSNDIRLQDDITIIEVRFLGW